MPGRCPAAESLLACPGMPFPDMRPLGVYASVRSTGVVNVGDPVSLL